MVAPRNFEPNTPTQRNFFLNFTRAKWPKQSYTVQEGSLRMRIPCIQGSGSWWNSCVRARTRKFSWQKCCCCWERYKNHWSFATEGITQPCSFSEERWNHLLLYDWKTVVGKTARQAKATTCAIYRITPDQFFIILIICWFNFRGWIFCSTADETLQIQYMVCLEAGPVGTCWVVMTAQIPTWLHKPNRLWPRNVQCWLLLYYKHRSLLQWIIFMPRWAEPRRHTVVCLCVCVCVSFCLLPAFCVAH